MCLFITAALPCNARHEARHALARAYGRQFRRLENAAIERQLGPAYGYYLTTLGHCDCGAPLG